MWTESELVQILVLPLTSCVTLDRSLPEVKLSFKCLSYKMGILTTTQCYSALNEVIRVK